MKEADAGDAIAVGTESRSAKDDSLVIWTDALDLQPHVGRPWLRAFAAAQLGVGVTLDTAGGASGREALVSAFCLERHACLFGATGSGKSRLALHLVVEQLRRGCSIVAIDPKAETIRTLLGCVRAAGLPPERTVLLDPADPEAGVPGWNPLLSGVPPAQAAGDFVSTLARSTASWGPRLADILTNSLVLLAAHGLSLYELPPLLTRSDYRAGLLRLPLPPDGPGGGAALSQARDFFAHEFSAWTRSEQAGAVAPVLNKTRGLLGSDFLQALLCAPHNSLDLASLWREPGAVLVHLDPTTLGDDGARLLGGLLAHHLYRAAMRQTPGPVPVVLALDEIGAQEQFIGDALTRIVTVARGQGLRLLAASQHLTGLSAGLRDALLANAAVQAFFRLGAADARPVAASFAAGADEPLCRASAQVASRDRGTRQAEQSVWRHPLRDAHDRPLRLGPSAWDVFRRQEMAAAPGAGFALRRVQELAEASGVSRLYVHAADTGAPVPLTRYVAGLPETDYWFDGPAPMELVVSFPTPRFSHVQRRSRSDLADRWVRTLQQLPVQHAALRLLGGEAEVIRVIDVAGAPPRPPDVASRRARHAGARTWDEVRAAADARNTQIERVAIRAAGQAAGRLGPGERTVPRVAAGGQRERPFQPPFPDEEVADDGSLA